MAYICRAVLWHCRYCSAAYIAGIVLLPSIHDAPYVERRVRISNYMMFAPVFFASIGLKTDISGLTPDILLFCVCFVIVALITQDHWLVLRQDLQVQLGRFPQVGVGMMTRRRGCFDCGTKRAFAVGMVDAVYFTAVILLIIVSSVTTPLALKTLFAKVSF